jgi:cytochrome oxidase Cu insertion factor (SCO1/SenC/PrrC family)
MGKTMRIRHTRCWSLAVLAGTLLAMPAAAQNAPRAMLGEKVPNLAFKDEQSKIFQLHDLKDQKAIVLVFLSFECPVSTSYC